MLDLIDSATELAGPAEPFVDISLLQFTVPLVVAEAGGLGGDVAIDVLKDTLGVGQGYADEGTTGDICPDQIEQFINCPETYLPGVHPTKTIDEKGDVVVDSHDPSHVEFNWGF